MRIELNGQPLETEAPDLAALLAERGLTPETVATALNGAFVPRERRGATPLSEGDRVEVLSPMQGG
ncbi:sulfur carrier protein [Meinhardsimonia xiamenensis]|jgi:sulfur carrier protein|uniref:Sulfur carrier protein n=1 Tax=Meinhardsimonia xiamenensis TaxID=990712 RepID=A0A1G9EE77_9RHOB|nr:sulfur carrier protein ThiS [Meinhardsimonia xiamenensis]PRX33808.1 sulfur carrier protein [Meinhardsimonia xiamenensis]SDK74414.1 sulfur carrier protein [Meinhardsimonia xiamenensis]